MNVTIGQDLSLQKINPFKITSVLKIWNVELDHCSVNKTVTSYCETITVTSMLLRVKKLIKINNDSQNIQVFWI